MKQLSVELMTPIDLMHGWAKGFKTFDNRQLRAEEEILS